MGYLTTITIHNDALDAFERNPALFGTQILAGIENASRQYSEVDVPFEGFCNYISVQPPRHADNSTIYVHWGGMVFNLNPYNRDFKDLAKSSPETLKKFISVADSFVKDAKRALKNLA
jgi:hypothetical protein